MPRYREAPCSFPPTPTPAGRVLTGPAGGTWQAGANGPSWTLDAVDFCRAVARRPASITVDELLNTEVPY